MMRTVLIGVAMVLLTLGTAWAVEEARVNPFSWPEETTFEFAIYSRSTGERMATAYYRVLREESEGREVYHIKYQARNELYSEAAECFFHPDTMLPLRSTRKTTDYENTYYQDVAYGNGSIIVRRRTNEQPVVESTMPAAGKFYDYESLIWMVPQIEFGGAAEVYLNLFVTINETKSTVLVNDLGPQQVTVLGNSYVTQGYSFNVNSGRYQLFTVVQDGRRIPARIDMGDFSFLNTKITPKNVDSPGSVAPPAQPITPQPVPPSPAPPQPADPPEDDEPADPNDNPLGPPPPGSRF